MRAPRLNPFRRNPAEDAFAAVQRLTAQHIKITSRLTAAVLRIEAAQAERRQALLDGDPTPAEMSRLDKACADAAEARAGVEQAARHVAEQLEDARRTYGALVAAAKRTEVTAACRRRADAIDTAAARLVEAARIFGDARIELQAAIAEHGLAEVPIISADGRPLTPEALCRPIVMAAVRLAAPGILPTVDLLGVPHLDDALIAARRAQSGKLRDHADDVEAGTIPPDAPASPGHASAAVRVLVEEAAIILKTSVRYIGVNHTPVLLREGPGSIPRPVAEAAVAADLGAWPGTARAVDFMREIERSAVKHQTGVRPGGEMKLSPDPLPTFVDLGFDLGAWLAAERARLTKENA